MCQGSLVEDLNLLYNPSFIESDGLILPKWELNNLRINYSTLASREPEDNERFLSLTAILDYFDNSAELNEEPWYDANCEDFLKAWKIAAELVDVWGNKLVQQFPQHAFCVSAHRLDQPKIKFHKIRHNQKMVSSSGPDFLTKVFNGT